VNAAQPPKPRRRIAGEAKPGEAGPPVTPAGPKFKLPKPTLPKRETSSPAPPSAPVDLPAAPPRLDAPIRRRKPSAVLVALVVLAVASVGFGVFGVWRGTSEWRSSSMVDAHADASDAAASAIQTIYTYQYNKLDQHMRASQATMTPKMAKTVPPTTRVLKKLAPLRKTKVKAIVRFAAPKECGDSCALDKATVLVFFDLVSAYADADKPTIENPRVNVGMVERNGKWLVDSIKSL
jgi:hypothetical protein